jgi:DNA-binding response OmpR family regulator
MADNFDKKLNILVIDPDEDFARDVQLFLEDSYYVDIRQTIDQLDYTIILNHTDIIIIAIDSVDENFIKLIEQIRNNHRKIKIIIMYTYISSEKEVEQKLMKYIDDLISKPFDVALLKTKVDSFL